MVLLYGNRTKSDIVFGQELEDLAQKSQSKIVHVFSNEPRFSGEQGYIDGEKIQRLVPDLFSRDIYLCGPPVMKDKILQELK